MVIPRELKRSPIETNRNRFRQKNHAQNAAERERKAVKPPPARRVKFQRVITRRITVPDAVAPDKTASVIPLRRIVCERKRPKRSQTIRNCAEKIPVSVGDADRCAASAKLGKIPRQFRKSHQRGIKSGGELSRKKTNN